jgi:hypothetical protein
MVLDHGAKLMEGTAREAQSDPRVIEAYLGQAEAKAEAESTDAAPVEAASTGATPSDATTTDGRSR